MFIKINIGDFNNTFKCLNGDSFLISWFFAIISSNKEILSSSCLLLFISLFSSLFSFCSGLSLSSLSVFLFSSFSLSLSCVIFFSSSSTFSMLSSTSLLWFNSFSFVSSVKIISLSWFSWFWGTSSFLR